MLQEVRLGEAGTAALAAAMAATPEAAPGLRVLDISGNSMGLTAAAALGRALGFSFSQLSVLDLSSNDLGSEGLTGLCAGLAAGCCKLLELIVADNKIKGVKDMFCMTAESSTWEVRPPEHLAGLF